MEELEVILQSRSLNSKNEDLNSCLGGHTINMRANMGKGTLWREKNIFFLKKGPQGGCHDIVITCNP